VKNNRYFWTGFVVGFVFVVVMSAFFFKVTSTGAVVFKAFYVAE